MEPAIKLAVQRTHLANERTQMAWIRTALSLISFGFAISHFHRILHHTRGPLGPRALGMMMIAVALFSLGVASVQHRRAVRALRAQSYDLPPSTAGLTAVLIMVVGVVAFVLAVL